MCIYFSYFSKLSFLISKSAKICRFVFYQSNEICDPILQKGVLRKKVYFEKNDKIGTDVKVKTRFSQNKLFF